MSKLTLNSGDVIVAERSQHYDCGALQLRKNAIVEVKQFDMSDDIRIYRTIEDVKSDDWFTIENKGLRFATSEEVELFKNGAKTLSDG